MHCLSQAYRAANPEDAIVCVISRDSATDVSEPETEQNSAERDDNETDRSDLHKELEREQRAESGWLPIITFLENRNGAASAKIKRKSAEYGMYNGLLHKMVETESGRKLAIVVPAKMRARVLFMSHDVPDGRSSGPFQNGTAHKEPVLLEISQ